MGKQINFLSDFPAGKVIVLITKIQNIARENGTEARIVGGAVRDWLMGRPVEDIDMAINMPMTRFINLLNKSYNLPNNKLFIYNPNYLNVDLNRIWHQHLI